MRKKFGIRQGDAFEVTIRTEGSAVVIVYTRVYQQKWVRDA
jgi:bifunctional DNA-binding transcriptional regulator/antitoxin component of YhaV-PrlF toxin-antitoxin module